MIGEDWIVDRSNKLYAWCSHLSSGEDDANVWAYFPDGTSGDTGVKWDELRHKHTGGRGARPTANVFKQDVHKKTGYKVAGTSSVSS